MLNNILEKLSQDENSYVRFKVAINSSTPNYILVELSQDKDSGVRRWAEYTLYQKQS